MKRAISISLGSSTRDRQATIKFKDEEILVERIGTDGDVAKARQMYLELDGKVDAFGVGGVDLVPAARETRVRVTRRSQACEGRHEDAALRWRWPQAHS
jgi:hypothetical protein